MSSKNKMSREQAEALYDDLRSAMVKKFGAAQTAALTKGAPRLSKPERAATAKHIADSLKSSLSSKVEKQRDQVSLGASRSPQRAKSPAVSKTLPMSNRGPVAAVMLVVFCALLKLCLALIEYSGLVDAQPAHASYVPNVKNMTSMVPSSSFSREELEVLRSLDSRRTKLEEREKLIAGRENDIEKRDAAFAAKLTELRDLTNHLKADRVRNERKRSGQLDQLAAVYGSMNPQESAALMEQLDVTIALSLLERMPEKRIGQILALMTPDRALQLTKMLSGGRPE
ncbi:MAG: hypothetical protein KDD42_04920 [Bdellovibrionales bacterium]|nr:hypothetical protein [Bdellovibrionales bacterium]